MLVRFRPWAAALLILLAAASRLWLIPVHLGLDPNEGWNGYQALRAMGAGPLYPPPGAMTGNNYPPLSFFVVGGLGRLVGDPIVAGRLLSLASVLAIAAAIAAILRRLGTARPAPAAGALLFLLLAATVLRPYLAMNDPQWLGHALMTASVLLLMPASPEAAPEPVRVAGAALLMLLGGLVKHNLVAWPLATTAWLGWYHRRALLPWLAAGAAAGAAAAVLGWALFGPDLFANLLHAPRTYSVARMVVRAAGPLLIMAPMLLWCAPLMRRRQGDRRIDLILLAIAISVPVGVIERSGAGVDLNAHFESAIALSIGCALAAGRQQERFERCAAGFLALLLAGGLVLEAVELAGLGRARRAWNAMQERIAAVPGPVACETPALCLWAGKPLAIDFFLYGQRARAEGGAPMLDRALAERRFGAIQLDPRRADTRDDPLFLRIAAAMRPAFATADGRVLMVPTAVERSRREPYSRIAPDARRRG